MKSKNQKQEQANTPHFFQGINDSKPNNEEFELSLFGPGIGECIVLHVGNDEWIIIDSFISSSSKRPIALDYLLKLGIEPSSVKRLIISHYHDDHIKGMSQLVEMCEEAIIFHSQALLKEEFIKLATSLSSMESGLDRESSGIKELGEIIQVLMRLYPDKAKVLSKFGHASANTIIFENSSLNCRVRALSPSLLSVNLALQEIAEISETAKRYRRIVPVDQNYNAVAIEVSYAGYQLILGSDLEGVENEYAGWGAILKLKDSDGNKADVFKIPHHGSSNGYSESLWENLIKKDAMSILTPYSRSGLPKKEMINKFKSHTRYIACTTRQKYGLPRREPAVERTLRSMSSERDALWGKTGQIQIRLSEHKGMKVSFEPPAELI